MSKYKVGDEFIVTITEVDESGMGAVYTLSDSIPNVTERMLDDFVPYNALNSSTEPPKEEKAREYTLEELQKRICKISDILNATVEAYRQAEKNLKCGIDTANKELDYLNE